MFLSLVVVLIINIIPIKLTIYKVLNINNIMVIIYYDIRFKLEKNSSKVIIEINRVNSSLETISKFFQ